ncbi:MAG: DNA translocase FtsK 4TM domain-containing protein [Pseudomonadota bacterium]|nr:DNA translocase FtsK 4TM domain-containing protein [Pseudomonadota bacterium]
MSFSRPVDTDESTIPAAMRAFLRNRSLEALGLTILAADVGLVVSLATWSALDASLQEPYQDALANWMGRPGAAAADAFLHTVGLGVIGFVAAPTFWSLGLLTHEPFTRPLRRFIGWSVSILALAGFLAILPPPSGWPLLSGLGGRAGDVISSSLLWALSWGLKGAFAAIVSLPLLAFAALWGFALAINKSELTGLLLSRVVGERGHDMIDACVGALAHWIMTLGSAFGRSRRRRREIEGEEDIKAVEPGPGLLRRCLRALGGALARARSVEDPRVEPRLSRKLAERKSRGASPSRPAPVIADEEETEDLDDAEDSDATGSAAKLVSRNTKPIKQGKRLKKDSQPLASGDFELPPLTLLSEPKRLGRAEDLSDEALEQNARTLESVLDDFGVRGEIINVHPGPVVTLYELEPAPGIKSSRVISLADDIARSMSAVAARVAVVPGRNAIGIELPNARRETVYLRELLGSEPFEKTSQSLALALGKNIGGEPVFADLARMPHLLIAGTTGSGKSVGINTMILSLVYRLTPAECRLIMIDPKMLELSVYEGIPHLLSPVVTDPKKAIVALKWAVREMEERYRRMSKLGVRNVDGYNARLAQSLERGETIKRRVQTGYDAESGAPIFEEEAIDQRPMPYIVVIIDEMADLMMVAGKDIEGAVQRLAQMARAAGIHVIMATQRPSVDVITGTIKANFPTRVSFQVTSKIDSRTILGEQGAEQLLGQGDMLYMAGGGRISRLHGPFVSDEEVEKIVRYLKKQGRPDYLDAVTEEPDEADGGAAGAGGPEGGSGDELYDQAVAVVLRDKKVSTSYIQRRLQIGYNKAASLIERMEKEGLIGQANATGKREILVDSDTA